MVRAVLEVKPVLKLKGYMGVAVPLFRKKGNKHTLVTVAKTSLDFMQIGNNIS